MQPPYQQSQYPNTSPGSLEPTQAAYTSRHDETTEPAYFNPYLDTPYELRPPPPPSKVNWKRRSLFLICSLLLITSVVLGYLYVNTPTKPETTVPTKLITVVVTPTGQVQPPTKVPQTLPSEAHVYDAAHVLNVSQVQNDATSLPYPLDIYTTNTFNGSTSAFDQHTAGHLTSSRLIVIAIDTGHKHLAIVGGSSVPLSSSQYSSARDAFVNSYRSSQDYTAATIAAIDSLRSSFTSDGY
jgi:hypothetical protein